MRRSVAALFGCIIALWCSPLAAQTIQTLVSNGPTSQRINVTFFSEGYTASELPMFITNVNAALGPFFSTSPYDAYANCFNVYAVSVTSAQSGADHYSPTARLVNTYFNSAFDSYGIDRVLTIPPNDRDGSYASGQGKVDALIASLIPESDLEVVLVNDPQYGGSGGIRLVASLDATSPEIVLHEMGHTLAELGDEYDDPYPYGSVEEPNTTRQTERPLIKWNSWILPSTPIPTPAVPSNYPVVGLFEGAHYHTTGWYRPQYNCKMRSLGAPYCAVCRETAVLSIYRLVRPIDALAPNSSIVTLTNSQTFRITPLKVAGYTYEWFTNGVAVPSSNRTNLVITPQMLGPGNHTLRVEVHDPTPFVRNDPNRLLFDTNWWAVNVPTALAIVQQPGSQAVAPGSTATFSVIATGTPPIRFQWRFNGGFLSGETASTLSLPNVTAQQAGTYDVVVRNDFLSLTSSPATLSVVTPVAPTLVAGPADQTVFAGQAMSFTAQATGSSPLSFFWRKGADIVASNMTGQFVLADAQFSDEGIYSVVISNAAGLVVSGDAMLTVLPVPLLPAGNYSGLFLVSNDVQHASSGLLLVSLLDDGRFTARIQVGRAKQSTTGMFGIDGRATSVLSLNGASLELRLQSQPNVEFISGDVSDGAWTASFILSRNAYHARSNPATAFAGRYTFLAPGAPDSSSAPSGFSFASVRVNDAGVVVLSIVLADGTRATARSTIVNSNDVSFYAPLYGGRGAVFGWLRLKPAGYIDLEGSAYWLRPAGSPPSIYPEGFTLEMPLIGSAYAPSSGTLFDIVLARALIDGGGLGARTNHVTLGLGGKVTSAGPDNVRLRLTPASGLFQGTITPAGSRPIKVQGAVLQRQRYGGGFFVGTNQAGRVYFGP